MGEDAIPVETLHGLVVLETPDMDGNPTTWLTAAEARRLAVQLIRAAEEIDPPQSPLVA